MRRIPPANCGGKLDAGGNGGRMWVLIRSQQMKEHRYKPHPVSLRTRAAGF